MRGMKTTRPFAHSLSVLLAMLVLVVATSAHAAPAADLWKRWVPDGKAADVAVDHSVWDGFLTRFVAPGGDGINRVDYGRVGLSDRQLLVNYIASLTAHRPSRMSPGEAKAYWINLYNALTVRTVLQHYPVDSIRDIDISPGLFSNGPWGAQLVEIEGVPVSLDDIEHRILRPIWQDPLIHYALNCAAVGCPQLRAEAFVPERLTEQLIDSAKSFVNHPRAVMLADGALSVSSIYEWFMVDFGITDKDVIDHIRQFADPALDNRLKQHNRIDDDFYDWTLNDLSLTR